MTVHSPKGRRPSSRRSFAVATALIVGAGLLWRVVTFLANWPLWGDEAYIAVSLITRDYLGLARPLEYYQIAPPGFLWAELATIRALGASEQALRLVPFVCGIGSLLLFWKFAATRLDRRSALVAVAFFAASFYPVRHANEVKPYAIDLLLAQAVTMLALAARDRPGSRWAWPAVTIVSTLGVWASYPLIFVSSGVGSVLLAEAVRGEGRRGAILRWCVFLAATVASWAAMYVLIARPQALAAPFLTQMATWQDAFPPLDRPWLLPWWLVKVHTGNMLAYPYGGNNGGSLATAILVGVGCVVLWRKDRPLLVLLLAPLGPALVAAALHRYPYGTSARISLFMAPAFCLLAGRGLTSILARRLSRPKARSATLGVTVAMGLVAAIGAGSSVAVPYKEIDDLQLKEIVQTLASQARPGDRWRVFNGLTTLTPDHELMLKPWLQHAAQFHFYVLRDSPVPVAWNPQPTEPPPAQSGHAWFFLHDLGYKRFPSHIAAAHVRLLSLPGIAERQHFDIRPTESIEATKFRESR